MGLFLDLCFEEQVRWLINPASRFSPAQQREHILAQIEPVPSVLRPGSASYGQAIRDLSGRLREMKDAKARMKLQIQIHDMAELHQEALADHG